MSIRCLDEYKSTGLPRQIVVDAIVIESLQTIEFEGKYDKDFNGYFMGISGSYGPT